MLTWKIVGVSKVSVLYIYIDNNNKPPIRIDLLLWEATLVIFMYSFGIKTYQFLFLITSNIIYTIIDFFPLFLVNIIIELIKFYWYLSGPTMTFIFYDDCFWWFLYLSSNQDINRFLAQTEIESHISYSTINDFTSWAN